MERVLTKVQACNRGQFSCWCTLDQTGDLTGNFFKERVLKQEPIQRGMLFLGECYISAGQSNLFQVKRKTYIGSVYISEIFKSLIRKLRNFNLKNGIELQTKL